MAWRSNYIPLFYMNVMAYPCPNPDAGLAKLCQQNEFPGFKGESSLYKWTVHRNTY